MCCVPCLVRRCGAVGLFSMSATFTLLFFTPPQPLLPFFPPKLQVPPLGSFCWAHSPRCKYPRWRHKQNKGCKFWGVTLSLSDSGSCIVVSSARKAEQPPCRLGEAPPSICTGTYARRHCLVLAALLGAWLPRPRMVSRHRGSPSPLGVVPT